MEDLPAGVPRDDDCRFHEARRVVRSSPPICQIWVGTPWAERIAGVIIRSSSLPRGYSSMSSPAALRAAWNEDQYTGRGFFVQMSSREPLRESRRVMRVMNAQFRWALAVGPQRGPQGRLDLHRLEQNTAAAAVVMDPGALRALGLPLA